MGAMQTVGGSGQQPADLVTAEHRRKLLRQSGERQVLQHVMPLERLDEEEAQCSHSLRHRLRSQLALAKQVKLVLADLFRAKLIGSTIKVFSKLLDREQSRILRFQGHSCDARVLPASGLSTELSATTEALLSSLWIANQIGNRYKTIPLRSRLPVIVLHS
jgi:hypothetical protein